MNKKGRKNLEGIVTLIFGTIIFIIFIGVFVSSGIIKEVFEAFEVFGAIGAILAILFIVMIIISVWEAFTKQ